MKVRRGRPPRLGLEAAEAGLVASLAQQVIDLLEDDAASPDSAGSELDPLAELVGPLDSGEQSDDPVVQRLLPDAYRGDEEAAGEWRRFGRSEVRSAKTEALQRVLADCMDAGPVEIRLDEEHANAWLAALTDVRLALGTRLDVTEDWVDDALRLEEDDPRRPAYAMYDWLSVLQESILGVVG